MVVEKGKSSGRWTSVDQILDQLKEQLKDVLHHHDDQVMEKTLKMLQDFQRISAAMKSYVIESIEEMFRKEVIWNAGTTDSSNGRWVAAGGIGCEEAMGQHSKLLYS